MEKIGGNILEKLYMRVTTDDLELPVAVAGSAKELADLCGTTENCVLSSISHERAGWLRIEIEEEIDDRG